MRSIHEILSGEEKRLARLLAPFKGFVTRIANTAVKK